RIWIWSLKLQFSRVSILTNNAPPHYGHRVQAKVHLNKRIYELGVFEKGENYMISIKYKQ
ncbi:hypothetical protein KI387_003850, partial [Taxus chinensis]